MTEPTQARRSGWESGLPVEDTLLRRFVFAYADRVARMADASGGSIAGTDEAAFADTGSPLAWENCVVLLAPPTPGVLERATTRAAQFFPPERSWTLVSVWPTPDLRWRDLTLVGHPVLWARPPGGGALPGGPPELSVREVGTPDAAADFERVILASEGVTAREGFLARSLVGPVLRLFVGYADGEPVSATGSVAQHGIVEVAWLGTVPEYRRKGYGSAVLAAVVRSAPPAPVLVLDTTEESRTLWTGLGFLPLLRTTVWTRPALTVPHARTTED